MPPETAPKIADQINEDRLRQWREKRAKVAEASRTERIRQAEEERRDRAKTAEEERAQRARDASEQRARDLATERAVRLDAARAKLAGRADVDATRERLLAHRTRAARALVVRLVACVALPTALVATYLFAVATPLFTAEATLAYQRGEPVSAGNQGALFARSDAGSEINQVRAILLAPGMFENLDRAHDLRAHFGGLEMDPLRRLRDLSTLQISETDQMRRFVDVRVHGFEGLISLRVHARSPEEAEAFATTMIRRADIDLKRVALASGTPQSEDGLRVVVPPSASPVAGAPDRIGGTLLALFAFASLYAVASIFLATLRRHADV